MDNYREYIEERLIGMYEVTNSVILEEFKKNKNESKRVELRNNFIVYLEAKYPNDNIRETIQNFKTYEEQEAFAQKYVKDYEDWSKANKKLNGVLIIDLLAIVLKSYGIISKGPFAVIMLLLFGVVISDMVKGYKENKKK